LKLKKIKTDLIRRIARKI